MKITTKKGDKGYTTILGGHSFPKYHLRIEALGTLDEANSALGLAKALSQKKKVKAIIHAIQEELFIIGVELASPSEGYIIDYTGDKKINEEYVSRLEALMDMLETEVELPEAFIIPGAIPSSAALDLARTIVRRAERIIAEMQSQGMIRNEAIIRYINRLSDVVYELARYEERAGEKKPVYDTVTYKSFDQLKIQRWLTEKKAA